MDADDDIENDDGDEEEEDEEEEDEEDGKERRYGDACWYNCTKDGCTTSKRTVTI